ncbi:glycerate kinase [Klebsiella pneumoniae]
MTAHWWSPGKGGSIASLFTVRCRWGVARVAKKYRKPVIGIAGSLAHDVGVVHQHGIDAVFSVLTSVSTLEEAFRGAFDNIYRASRNIAATLQVGMTTEG